MFRSVFYILLFVFYINTCSVSVHLNNDSCLTNNICTIEDALQACMNDSRCTNDIDCGIKIEYVNLSGSGNINLTLEEYKNDFATVYFAFNQSSVNITEGYFLSAINTVKNISLYATDSVSSSIFGSSSTAVTFINSDPSSYFEFIQVNIENCTSDNGPAGLLVDTSGTIRISYSTAFTNLQSNGDCGAVKFQLYSTTQFVHSDDSGGYTYTSVNAAGNGGAICIYGNPGVNVSIPVQSFANTRAINGGGMYLQGPGDFIVEFTQSISSSAQNGIILYAEDFDSISLINSEYALQAFFAGNGGIFLQSTRPSSFVTIAGVIMRESTVSGDGAGFYIKDVQTVLVENSFFLSCATQSGIGAGILFNNVQNITMSNTNFVDDSASKGAGMACIGGGSIYTSITDVFFFNSISTSLDDAAIDIYTDGSCEDSFWTSQINCPQRFSCASCPGSDCGIGFENCYCYCDSISCHGTLTSTPTSTLTPSTIPSVTPSKTQTQSPKDITLSKSKESPSKSSSKSPVNSSQISTSSSSVNPLKIIFFLIVGISCILFVICLGGAAFFAKQYYSKDYDTIDYRSPDTPQRDNDEFYHHLTTDEQE